MRKSILTILVSVISFSSCTTMYFDRGEAFQSKNKTALWHHNFALGLYEGSLPVNLKNECGNVPWNSVKTETTFINGFAGEIVNLAGPIWYPKTVEIVCD